MASKWLKTLHCKSNNTLEDVHLHRPHTTKIRPRFSPQGCRSTSIKPTTNNNEETCPEQPPTTHAKHQTITKQLPPPPALLPTLTELHHGHSSRRVVELIFSSGWSPFFPGEVEVVFKVSNTPRAVARFEEHRAAVRARAGPAHARCAADGNEMMMFHVGSGEPVYDGRVITSVDTGGGVRTFEGSGKAHERCCEGASEGRRTRRGMMVCRVIAGRVRAGYEASLANCESIWVGRGELVVLDPRAVLPCFLIIYTLQIVLRDVLRSEEDFFFL